MASSGTKRTTGSEQSEETFAVCQSCSRLSYNLKTCDKCGSTLNEENAAVCYSAEPKRPRLEQTGAVSSTSTPDINGKNSTVNGNSNNQPSPVPQALYVNKKNTAGSQAPTSGDNIRPQALYVNLNNQAFPINRVQQAEKASANRPMAGNSQAYPSSAPGYASPMANSGMPSLPSLGQQPQVMTQRAPTSSGMVAVMNNQPHGSLAQTSNSSYLHMPQSNPNTGHLSGAATGRQMVPNVRSASSSNPTVVDGNITFNVHQIRIGTRKFRAVSPVSIKDDGILFTLKDYTHAPVLLNARAIVKCKLLFAWGNVLSTPVIFLYLENSCMRQIQKIFSLTDADFSENSTVNTRKCISIFPIIPASDRNLQQTLTDSVKAIFQAMMKRYTRSDSILEEITPETAIDLLFDTDGSHPVQSANAAPRQAPVAHQHMMQADRQAAVHSQQVARPAVQQSRPHTNVQQSQGTNPGHATPLTIPNDRAKWEQMKKGLVEGGVYHVQTSTGRRYCLWDGRELKPCVVQNSEVQLSCSNIRIGSMVGQAHGQVKVKMDPPSGLSFSVKTPRNGIQDIIMTTGDIIKCEVCFERVVALFVFPTWVAGQRVAQKLGLSKKNDPMYDPHSAEDRRKHLILFLKDVNQDQREALLQMKAANNKPFIDEIDVLVGRSILTKIKRNTLVQSKMDNYLTGNENAHQSLESLAREVTNPAPDTTTSNQAAADDDDDDDDVIMTSEEVGVKCPYSQRVMKEPVRNKVCGHNYDKVPIHDFIMRKKGTSKCPYAGCGNQIPLRMEDLIPNHTLKKYILDNYKE